MIVIDEKDLMQLGVDKKIVRKLRKDTPESSPKVEIDKTTLATLQLVKVIKELVNKPGNNNVDLTPIVEAIYNIQETQLNVMQLLEKKIEAPKAKNFEFTVVRNKQGSIHKIMAKEA